MTPCSVETEWCLFDMHEGPAMTRPSPRRCASGWLRLSGLTLVGALLGSLGVRAGDATAAERNGAGAGSPAAPPVKLATLGEASPEFAQKTGRAFLNVLDLSLPEMADVKVRVDAGDRLGALDVYRDLLVNHLKKLTRNQKLGAMHPHWNYSGSEDLLKGYVLIGRHAGGISVNYLGFPGAIDWFKIGVDRVYPYVREFLKPFSIRLDH